MVHMVRGRLYSVRTVYKPHGCRRLNHGDGVRDRLTSLDASITGDELDSAVQLPNFRSLVAWHAARMMQYSARVAGLRQPRERVKFGQQYLSEKVALSF